MRIAIYFLLGLLFMLFQTVFFPRLFPIYIKPDLLLILVVYLGVNERYGSGGLLAYTFGCLLDVFAGSFMGMYGLTFLILFFTVRGTVSFFNSENPLLLLFLVFCGTLVEAALLILFGFMAQAGDLWLIVIRWIVPQVVVNLLVGGLLLFLATRMQRRFPRFQIPGLSRLNEGYDR
ncbi:MAG: rod shape-determining protein MreD [Desulfuromonas sp.]|nr:MAG: rod shape-determining protein MreD [Desulfuromonas sp.]